MKGITGFWLAIEGQLISNVQNYPLLEGHGTLFSGIEKLVAGLYMTLLPEAGG